MKKTAMAGLYSIMKIAWNAEVAALSAPKVTWNGTILFLEAGFRFTVGRGCRTN